MAGIGFEEKTGRIVDKSEVIFDNSIDLSTLPDK